MQNEKQLQYAGHHKFEGASDEELLDSRSIDRSELTDYLLVKYKKLVAKNANRLFIIGAETDDLIQEGMIGLFHAITDYDIEKNPSFYYFADMCIKRQMYKAIRNSQTKKQMPLNTSVSIDETYAQETGDSFADPQDLFIERENTEEFVMRLRSELSPMENKVLARFIAGFDYREIAQSMQKSPKAIDNALTRIKKKAIALRDQI